MYINIFKFRNGIFLFVYEFFKWVLDGWKLFVNNMKMFSWLIYKINLINL